MRGCQSPWCEDTNIVGRRLSNHPDWPMLARQGNHCSPKAASGVRSRCIIIQSVPRTLPGRAISCMLYFTWCNAVCRILYVLPYDVYCILYVVCCTRYAVCCMMYAVWRMLYIVDLMFYVGSMLYAVCFTMIFNVSYCNVPRRF